MNMEINFKRKCKNKSKVILTASNDGYKGTLKIFKYLDNNLFYFLNSLFNNIKQINLFYINLNYYFI